MGYESRFYFVRKTDLNFSRGKNPNPKWAQNLATFNMGKLDYYGETMKLIKESPNTDCFIYADDGNTQIFEDCYGDKLTEIDVEKLVEAFRQDHNKYTGGLFYKTFLMALYGFKLESRNDKSLIILHYGY